MSKSLLIIDDDPVFCFILKKLITKNGDHSVTCFQSAKRALDFLDDAASEDDFLIFLDLNMPVMNGWEFLQTMESKTYECLIDVAIITSSIDPEDKKQSKTYSPVIDLITKPITNEELDRILKLTSTSVID